MHDVAKPVRTRAKLMRFTRKPVVLSVLGLIGAIVVLFGIKALQIKKMMSTPFTMPATAVPVWWSQPRLGPRSAVGSISAVQAVVSTELGGVVANVAFQNGGVAKRAISW
jgi:hypothetical protein